jgi:parallel beta-helix repeat protein
MGAIKLHFCVDTLLEGNLIRDNDCFGIWLDNTYRGARVTRNVLLNNQREGIFCELDPVRKGY